MTDLLSARSPYSAIVDRPVLKLPNQGRLLVWIIVNVEHWSIERAMPRMVLSPPMGQPMLPDLPNWAWHEYGMRVGFWRLYDALNQRGIVPTMATNGIVCEASRDYRHAHRHRFEDFILHANSNLHRRYKQSGLLIVFSEILHPTC
jgi:hypothetical protein